LVADRPEWTGVLVGLRQGRGWSQADLARALQQEAARARIHQVAGVARASIVRSIIRWENDGVKPDNRYQLLLVRVYANRDGQIAIGPASELDYLMVAFEMMGVSSDRRAWLRAAAASIAAAGVGSLASFLAPTVRERLDVGLDEQIYHAGIA
jgi:hypothetical protein